jgi:hypothetical protein
VTHALVLFGVCIAANLRRQARRLAVVVLSELEAVAHGGSDQMFTAPLQQARISWKSDRFGHHRRVDDHALMLDALITPARLAA